MKKIMIAICSGFIVTLALSLYSNTIQSEISDSVLRLHVLANSDSAADQALKLKVRDRLLAESRDLFQNCTSPSEARAVFSDNHDKLQEAAAAEIKKEGFTYPVSIALNQSYFPTRHYGNVSLPAGEYEAVRVEIGNASGKNWWCVMFPPLCFVDGSVDGADAKGTEMIQEQLGDNADIITKDGTIDLKLRFKLVDIFQSTSHAIREVFKKA